MSLCEGRDGSLWMGSDFDGGLTRLKDGTATHYTWKAGFPNAGVRVIHEDRAGGLWIGTARGLARLRNGKFTTYTNGIAGNQVRAHLRRRIRRPLVWHRCGLEYLKDGKFTHFTKRDGLGDNEVTALNIDTEKNLWIGDCWRRVGALQGRAFHALYRAAGSCSAMKSLGSLKMTKVACG